MSGTRILSHKNKHELDMTRGSITGNIFRFALPLLVGNLFQQLYNMVDVWVIGQSGDSSAYAAVGSVGPIINILIGFFAGLASGAGVVISQYFGAKDDKSVSRAVHTAMAMTAIMAAVFTVAGVLISPLMLRLMLGSDSSESLFNAANDYLMIYFGGVSGLMFYNMGAGILRAVGDSRRPLVFLIVSAFTNVVLDLLFVFRLGMGAEGVALATIIAQLASAELTMFVLIRDDSCVKLHIKRIRIDMFMLKRIVKIGFPAAIQMALTAFANVFVQSYIGNINGDKQVNLGSWTTYSKVDQFIFLPIQSIALAVSTFVGQNLGCGNVARAKKGARTAYLLSTLCSVCIMVPVMIFAPRIVFIFNKDDVDIAAQAVTLLTYITPFYLFCSVNQVFSASLRGAGNSKAPMLIMLSSFIGVRQIYLFVMSNFISNDLIPIAMSYPVGWAVCALCTIIYYRRFDMGSFRLERESDTAAD